MPFLPSPYRNYIKRKSKQCFYCLLLSYNFKYVARDLKYNTTKDRVRYRVVKKNADGTVKVERADVLKNLPNTIAINSGKYIPFYYKSGQNGCNYNSNTDYQIQGCINNNIFKVEENGSEYNYKNSINIGNFLNSSSNSFYNWYSDNTKSMIKETTYDRYTGGYGKDYSILNDAPAATYPSTTDDEKIIVNVTLPSWGEMYTGNDLNMTYWYINRWTGSSSQVSYVNYNNTAGGSVAGDVWRAVRPVVTLKSTVKIKSGEGTMTKPYSLFM